MADPFGAFTVSEPAAAGRNGGRRERSRDRDAPKDNADPFGASLAGRGTADPFGASLAGGGTEKAADPFGASLAGGGTEKAADPFGASLAGGGGSSAPSDPFASFTPGLPGGGSGGLNKDPFANATPGGGAKDPFASADSGSGRDPFGAAGAGDGGGVRDPFGAVVAATSSPRDPFGKPGGGRVDPFGAKRPAEPEVPKAAYLTEGKVNFRWLLDNGPNHAALTEVPHMSDLARQLCVLRGCSGILGGAAAFVPPIGSGAFPPGWMLIMNRRGEEVDRVALEGKYYMIAGSDKRKADLKMLHHSISPLHASWYYHPARGCMVFDLYSAYGTFLGHDKIKATGATGLTSHTNAGMGVPKPTVWPPGEKVKFGKCQDEWVLVTPQMPAEAVMA